MTGKAPEPDLKMLNASSDVQTIFADGLLHVSGLGGVARLSFVESKIEPLNLPEGSEGWRTRHVVTIAVPLNSLPGMVEYLQNTIVNFRDAGIMPPAV